jgi:hypothetical protein
VKKVLEFFKLVRAETTPGSYGDEQLQIALVPKRGNAMSAENIAAAVRELIAKERANFRGKSVRITIEDLQVCRECGCTEDAACEGGCSWVEMGLCSACTPEALAARGEGP